MIVVTGGAGFIGSNLASALCARGAQVVVVDWLGDDDVKWRNLAKTPLERLLTPEALPGFLEAEAGAVEAVVHLGAISATTARDADLVVRHNLTLSRTLWDWCTAHARPLIYASSAATYGDGAQGFDDDASPAALQRLRPLNLYGWSKHAFDVWVARALAAGRPAPPQWVGLKFFNVYGPNEYHKGEMMSLVAKRYPQFGVGAPVQLFRSHRRGFVDGGQMRDFVYVADAVSVMLWLLDHGEVSGLFNLGAGEARTFRDLILAGYTASQTLPSFEYIDMPASIREQYQYFTRAPMARLRAAGYDRPFVSLEDGVRDYVVRFLSQRDRHV